MRSKSEAAERLAAVTAAFLITAGILQIFLGEFVSRSVALTANGIDCAGDGLVSLFIWFGLRWSKRPADEKFHFGYYRIETIGSVAAAMVMLFLAAYIGYRSYEQFVNPHALQLPLLGAGVALSVSIITAVLGFYKLREGKKTGLLSVKLDAKNTLKDAATSFLVVIAILFSSLGFPVADAAVGFIVAVIILHMGFTEIKESTHLLVDACTSCSLEQSYIRGIAEEFKGVRKARDAKLRRSGSVLLGEMEIEVDAKMTVEQADRISSDIKHLAMDKIPELERLTITTVPVKSKDR